MATALLLAGCSTPAVDKAAPAAVDVAQASQPVGTRMPQTDADMCKAADLQWLVGKSKSEIPVPVDVVNRRVVCSTCPVTEDYSPYRLNIFFNADTDVVELVRCG